MESFNLQELVFIAGVHFLALLSPGADFILIVRSAIQQRLVTGICLCLGIALANLIYILIAILSYDMLSRQAWLLELLRFLGTGYLLYLGVMILTATSKDPSEPQQEPPSNRLASFTQGLAAGLLNPKNGLFYLSLFTLVVAPSTNITAKLVYGLWMAAAVLIWDVLVLLLIHRGSQISQFSRFLTSIERVCAMLLIGFGLTMGYQALEKFV